MYARRIIAGVLLLATAACSRVTSVSPAVPYIQANSPDQVWITTRSGTESLVYRPKIMEDSLFGFDLRGQQLTIPVDVVQSAKIKTRDSGKTALAVGATAAVLGVAGVILIKGASSKTTPCVNTATVDCRYITSRGVGVSIPASTTAKIVGSVTRALFGSK